MRNLPVWFRDVCVRKSHIPAVSVYTFPTYLMHDT